MRIETANGSLGNPRTNTIGMSACMPMAIAQRPTPVIIPPGEGDQTDRRERDQRPGSGKANRARRDQRNRKAEAHDARFLASWGGKIRDAGRNRAQRRRLSRREAEDRGKGRSNRNHADPGGDAINDVETDEQPLEVRRSPAPRQRSHTEPMSSALGAF